ncbi:DUF559 domain-containing protein [Caulobacter sp. NIBR1757]|nr:DUF559 domain-containing protein [Caulobacter sp. NIBR1757]
MRIAGYRVLRFKNAEIGSDTAKVLDTIRMAAGR